jgi:diguanylate cyclase (GGDEF)-like protein
MAFMLKGKLGIPDSRYAAELDKRAAEAKFAPDLEAEYDEFFLSERRSQLRWFTAMLFALVLWACLVSLDRGHDGMQRLRLMLMVLGCATLTWAAFSRSYQDIYLSVARWATSPIAILAAFETAYRIAGGQGEALAWLVAYSIGLYFMLGLRYGAAVQSSLAVLASFAVALIINGQTLAQTAHTAGIASIIVGIVALAYFQQALRVRKAFLERGLIADLAARDGLTGLKNRRAFDEHLIRSWQQALRDRKTISVMFIDVDAFKKFNDRYGHKAGDIALQRIAGVVHSVAKRALDLAARYGGEELAVILYDVPREAAQPLAEAMRAAVMNLGIEHLDGTPLDVVTISIGVGIVRPTLARSPDGAVQLADEALYAAKRNGRNRVEVFESEYDALSTGTFRTRADGLTR